MWGLDSVSDTGRFPQSHFKTISQWCYWRCWRITFSFFFFFCPPHTPTFIGNDWCRMCVCECARVERTSEGELPELLSELITKVASNNRTGAGGLSVDSGSLAGQSVTASNPPPAAVIKSVCACACVCARALVSIFVSWLSIKDLVCLHRNAPQQFQQRADQGTRRQTQHRAHIFSRRNGENIPVGGAGPSRLSKINPKPSGVLLCDFTRLPAVCRRFPNWVSRTTSEVQPDCSVLKICNKLSTGGILSKAAFRERTQVVLRHGRNEYW